MCVGLTPSESDDRMRGRPARALGKMAARRASLLLLHMLAAAILFAPGSTTIEAAAAPTASVPNLGKVIGALTAAPGVAAFKGIPYAEPPTGKLRWQPPIPKAAWSPATLNATDFGNACIQRSHVDDGFGESCLFLNVYAPTATLEAGGGAGLPVMLWIHGGSYVSGASNLYPGEALVSSSNGSVVVITINYRLNVFGFLGSHELQARSSGGTTGNLGIEDQRLAMVWARDNVASFGGNPTDVTIFGESAGGNSVINHLAQPASAGLYTKAIVESGAYDTGARPLAAAQGQFEALLGKTKCSGLDCLLALDAAAVEAAAAGGWGPTVDGVSLTAAPAELIAAKKYNNKVPVLIGSNRDEMAYFTIDEKVPPSLTEAGVDGLLLKRGLNMTLITALKKIYDPNGPYVYPKELGSYSTWYWMNMRIATDAVPGLGCCAVRWFDQLLLDGGTPAVFSYLYAHPDQEKFVPGESAQSFVPHPTCSSRELRVPVMCCCAAVLLAKW